MKSILTQDVKSKRNKKHPFERTDRNKLVYKLKNEGFSLNQIAKNEEVLKLSNRESLTKQAVFSIYNRYVASYVSEGGDSK